MNRYLPLAMVTPLGMMLKRGRSWALLGVVFVGCARNPVALAERFSGLEIPASAEVLEFKDEASGLVGEDLWVRVVLRLSEPDFDRLLEQAEASGDFLEISTASNLPEEVRYVVGPAIHGLYRYERDAPNSWGIAVLDRDQRTLLVDRSIT